MFYYRGPGMTTKRLTPKERKAQILNAALVVAERRGYMNIERSDVAKQAGTSEARVSQLFNTMIQLRKAVMRRAVHVENYTIIAQGLTVKDRQALKAPEEVRIAAVAAIL